MKKIFACVVTFAMPPGATVRDCRDYVKLALETELGFRDPNNDAMSELNRASVTVGSCEIIRIAPEGAKRAKP